MKNKIIIVSDGERTVAMVDGKTYGHNVETLEFAARSCCPVEMRVLLSPLHGGEDAGPGFYEMAENILGYKLGQE
jgi:hypothetical protein